MLAYLSLISIWQIVLRYFKIFRKYYEGGIPMCNYLFKDNNGNTRAIWKICSKLTKKTTGWHRSHYFGVFVNLVIWRWSLWCFHYWFWTSKYWLGLRLFWVMYCHVKWFRHTFPFIKNNLMETGNKLVKERFLVV